jgi:autotransporter-associated beta strand protein
MTMTGLQKRQGVFRGSITRQRSCRALLIVAAAGIASGLAARSSNAATYVFDPALNPSGGSDGIGNWDSGATSDWYNVSGGVVGPWSNSTADTAIFGSGGTAGTVTVSAVNASVLEFNTVSGSYLLNGGTITFGNPGTITTNAGVSATINSTIAGSAMVFKGGGNLTLGGNNTYSGTTTVNSGTVSYTGTSSSVGNGSLDVANAAGSTAVLNIGGTGVYNFSNGVTVADASTNSGAINQTAGTVNLESTTGSYVTIGNGGYGSYTLSGNSSLTVGSSVDSTGIRVGGGSATGVGVFLQSGGTLLSYRYLAIANAGVGVATFTGGTSTINVTRSLVGDSANSTSTFNLGTEAGGSNTFNTTLGLELLDSTSTTGSSTTNLNSGILNPGATGIYKGVTGNVFLNLNGGTILGSATGLLVSSADSLTGTVYNGGASFNISSGVASTVAASLVAATGNGVYVPGGVLPVASGSGGAGYIGAPFVTVSGGGGTGATAIANVSNGTITGVILTNPGQGYTPGSTISFSFTGGGATTVAPTYSYTFGATSDPNLTANGTGGLSKAGPGTLLLTGNNTYTGVTNITAGTLEIGSGGTTGSISPLSTISIASGATLAFNQSGTVTVSNSINGAGGLSQYGSGTLKLSGTFGYTGPTNASVGTLVLLPSGVLSNTAVSISSGATFNPQTSPTVPDQIGFGSGSLNLLPGSKFTMVDNSIGSLKVVNTAGSTGLTIGAAGGTLSTSLSFELGSTAGSVDNIAVTGNASVLSAASINIVPLAADTTITPGNYTLISAGGGLNSSNISLATSTYVIGSTGYSFSLANSTPTAEILSVTQVSGSIATAYWAGAVNNTWNYNASNTTNWRTDATSNIDTGVIPGGGTNVYFTVASGGSNLATTLGANYSINSITFNGYASAPVSISNYTLTINALGLNGNPTGTGLTMASNSTAVTINSNVVLGSSQTWTNNSTSPLTINGGIGGAALTQAGSGPVVLAGSNSFSGGYNLAGGSLAINNASALGTGPLLISAPVTIDNTSGSPIALVANNPQTWNSDFTFVGSSSLNMGSGTVTLGSNRIVTISNNSLTVGGITDNGAVYSLTLPGPGTLNVIGTSSYSGATSIQGGTLNLYGGSTGNGSLDIANQSGQTALLNINTTGNVSFGSTVTVSDNPGALGAINQINGNVSLLNNVGGAYVDLGNSSYGAYTLIGGTLTIGTAAEQSGIRVGYSPSGVGVFTQTGGTFTSNRYLAVGSGPGAASGGGYGVATFTGGTTTILSYRTSIGDGVGSIGVFNLGTLAGGTNFYSTGGNGGLVLVNGTGATGIANLNSGTLNLSQGSIYQGTTGTGTVNLNGATILAGASGLTLIDNSPTSVNVYSGGANFNVPTGSTATVSANLLATTGNGIYAQGSGGSFAVSGNSSVGYLGSPVVGSISGGSGSGAMAIANVTNGVITSVTMTNPGQGYQVGDNLTFNFSDGGYNTTASPFNYTLTAADVAANNSPVTKTGGGTLTLSGASTYTGNTFIKGGTLIVANSAALGTGSAIIYNGATLGLASVTVGTSLSGFSTNSNGVYTPVIASNGLSAQLTTAAGQEATSVFSPSPVTFNDATGFAASFTYTHANTAGGADGVAFVIQSQGANALGAAGGAMGYSGANNVAAGGIANSIAADINLYQNEIETGVNGVFTNIPGAGTYGSITTSSTSNVTVVYNGSTQTLTETITSPGVSPYVLTTTGIDLASILGGTAGGTATGYFGFTGGTGGVEDSQSVSNFIFNNNGTTLTASSTATSFTNPVVVAPASSGILQLAATTVYSTGSVGPITIGTGSTLTVSIGSSPALGVTHGVLTTPSVTFASSTSGTLDVGKNALDITSMSLSQVNAMVATAYSNGTWTGPGITSTAAAGDSTHLTALGVIYNSVDGSSTGAQLYGSGTAEGLFEGISPASTDVLVKYTYYGDTNLDGEVDGSDYSRIDNAFITDKTSPGALTGWFNGDFNYDGVINGSDYTLMDNAFNQQGVSLASEIASPSASVGTSAVPEPASVSLVAAGAIGLLGRRRRRSN